MSYEAIKTVKIGNLVGKLYTDEDAESPREWSEFGVIYHCHPRYNLGDEKCSAETVKFILNNPGYVSVPVYPYDHSVRVIKASVSGNPFRNPVTTAPDGTMQRNGYYQHADWDSGLVGVIMVHKADVRRELNVKKITQEVKVRVQERLINDVASFGQYILGDVYSYAIETIDGENIDSLSGMYGLDYAEQEMITAMRDNGAEGESEEFFGDVDFEDEDEELTEVA